MGEGLDGSDAAELLGDRPMDAVEVCQYLVAPQNAMAFVFQEPNSLGLRRRRAIVLAAVDFHDEPGLVAHLAAELAPLHLMRARDSPDPPFRVGHVLPQPASSCIRAVDRMLLHVSTCVARC